MNEKALSERLAIVASYLPLGSFFADIGSDHAYLPCYVCLNDPTAKAIAGEVNEGPYQSALKEVEQNDLLDRVSVRKGDGLDVIEPNEVDQVTIAGMGGTLIASILERGKDKLTNVKRIIVQPNVDAESCRRWFETHGFDLVDETIIEEAGHIYEVLVADATANDREAIYSEVEKDKELYFGPYLLQKRQEAFIKKWTEEKAKKERVLSQIQKAKQPEQQKIAQIEHQIKWIEEVIANE
jgi:tRNA (adenine22-N1)-methyltransferase